MTVTRLLQECGDLEGIPEQLWWIAFNNIEPLANTWQQTGTIAAAVCNASGLYKSAMKADDFIPRCQREQPPELQEAKFLAIVGNRIKRDK